jgi:N-acetylglucosaminyldiphosphoundecaprenol N-acetyl-beta-D-mannosaminyltransferase
MPIPTTAPAAPAAAPAQSVATPPMVPIVGMPLALTNYDETMRWMDERVHAGDRVHLSAAAVHLVMVAQEEPAVREAVLSCTLTVPDGQPLVWALRALGHEGASRVYGPELMARYFERSVETGMRHYLYGGRSQGALVELALALRRRYPGVRIVGGYSPPFRPLSDEEEAWVVDDVNRSGADVVWVGIGQPKQEVWMARMRERLSAPVLAGVGAAFDFHAGLVPQAPNWMQDSGLEWVYRLVHEPRRLWRRYARYNPLFVAGFVRQYALHRLRGGAGA